MEFFSPYLLHEDMPMALYHLLSSLFITNDTITYSSLSSHIYEKNWQKINYCLKSKICFEHLRAKNYRLQTSGYL